MKKIAIRVLFWFLVCAFLILVLEFIAWYKFRDGGFIVFVTPVQENGQTYNLLFKASTLTSGLINFLNISAQNQLNQVVVKNYPQTKISGSGYPFYLSMGVLSIIVGYFVYLFFKLTSVITYRTRLHSTRKRTA